MPPYRALDHVHNFMDLTRLRVVPQEIKLFSYIYWNHTANKLRSSSVPTSRQNCNPKVCARLTTATCSRILWFSQWVCRRVSWVLSFRWSKKWRPLSRSDARGACGTFEFFLNLRIYFGVFLVSTEVQLFSQNFERGSSINQRHILTLELYQHVC